jgi:membrane protein
MEAPTKRLKKLNFVTILKNTFREWNSKDPFRESAIIAYYSIFSIPGLFVVIIAVAGLFFGQDVVNNQVMNQVTASMGEDTANQIQSIVARHTEEKKSLWAAIAGIVTLLIGATGVFVQFQKSLNIIWEVKADQTKSGIWTLIRSRLFSFGLIISIAFLMIISLMISTLLAAFGNWLSSQFSESLLMLLRVLNFLISLSILTFLFALMLKIFPDAKIKWKDVWIGSLVTSILFIAGKFALSLYFGKANPASAYGAAGSVILILLWVSYSSMIVLFGAEFTRQYANVHSGKPEPSGIARRDEPCNDKKGQ